MKDLFGFTFLELMAGVGWILLATVVIVLSIVLVIVLIEFIKTYFEISKAKKKSKEKIEKLKAIDKALDELAKEWGVEFIKEDSDAFKYPEDMVDHTPHIGSFEFAIPHIDVELELRRNYMPAIRNVYFNKPYTVVIWKDGTKTIAKCHKKDKYSKAAGFMICWIKKITGMRHEEYTQYLDYAFSKNKK